MYEMRTKERKFDLLSERSPCADYQPILNLIKKMYNKLESIRLSGLVVANDTNRFAVS